MTTANLKTLIDAAQEMSPGEREELIRAVSRSMPPHESPSATVSEPHLLLAQLARSQGVSPVENVADMVLDFWPEDESADDINNYIYGQRHEDRMRE